MSDFRCPRYWWDGSQWRCQNLPNDYLSSYDFDTYCTNKNRCLECPYMDSEVREKVAAYKKEVDERVEEHVEEQRREYEAEQRNKENDYSYRENNNTSSTTTYSSSGSSEIDLLGIIVGLIVLLIKVVPALFMYFLLPLLWSQTIWFSLFIVLSAPSLGFNPFIAYGGMLIMYIVALPYWFILFIQKRKRRMSWKETLKYYSKWAVKGPWAYKDIIELKNSSSGN